MVSVNHTDLYSSAKGGLSKCDVPSTLSTSDYSNNYSDDYSNELNRYLKPSQIRQPEPLKPLRKAWHGFLNVVIWLLAPSNEPRVTECRDRQGNTCWRVYHPATGKTAVLYSEQEVIV
jgi:hypothetical protein